jgi:hypothetical protein
MVAARRIVLAIYAPTAMSSTMVFIMTGVHILISLVTTTILFGRFSLEYWCRYSCRCWFITSMDACVQRSLGIVAQIEIMGEP